MDEGKENFAGDAMSLSLKKNFFSSRFSHKNNFSGSLTTFEAKKSCHLSNISSLDVLQTHNWPIACQICVVPC